MVVNLNTTSETVPFNIDHYLVTFDLISCQDEPAPLKPLLVYDYKKADWTSINDFLLDFNFDICYESRDVDEIWSFLKLAIHEAMSLFIPKVFLKKNQHPKWFSAETRHLANCFKTMTRKAERSPTANNVTRLKDASIKLQDCFDRDRSDYESGLINTYISHKNSSIFKYIKFLKEGSDIPQTVRISWF